MEFSDPKQRLINEQRKQIKDLNQELQKAHSHIDAMYQLNEGGEESVKESKKISKMIKPESITYVSKESFKPLRASKLKNMNEVDEEAIRKALSSTGDKSILIEKLVNVLRLARDVQNSNSQLRQDMIQMSNIIDDLNAELYEKQLEISNLIGKEIGIYLKYRKS